VLLGRRRRTQSRASPRVSSCVARREGGAWGWRRGGVGCGRARRASTLDRPAARRRRGPPWRRRPAPKVAAGLAVGALPALWLSAAGLRLPECRWRSPGTEFHPGRLSPGPAKLPGAFIYCTLKGLLLVPQAVIGSGYVAEVDDSVWRRVVVDPAGARSACGVELEAQVSYSRAR
jgi:hypothetical protein